MYLKQFLWCQCAVECNLPVVMDFIVFGKYLPDLILNALQLQSNRIFYRASLVFTEVLYFLKIHDVTADFHCGKVHAFDSIIKLADEVFNINICIISSFK